MLVIDNCKLIIEKMEIEIKIPTVGESITEVTLAQWLKKDGDMVQQDEVIAEIESDKASFELNAEQAGVLKIIAKEGATVAVGSKIATINTSAKVPAADAKPVEQTEKAPPAETTAVAQPEKAPETEGKPEAEGEKTTTATSPPPIAVENTAPPKPDLPKNENQNTGRDSYASGTPSPAAKKILDEKSIPTTDINGTGRDGRITKNDALQAQPKSAETASAQATEPDIQSVQSAQPQPAGNKVPSNRNIRREKMSTLRKTIARRLVDAKNLTAMLTTFNEVDMTAVMEMRKKYKDAFKEKHGVGLGFMSIFTRAVCEAIKDFPAINALIDDGEFVYHDYVDVGIAVSTPRGLVVPVVRNAESMSLADMEKKILDLAVRARDNKISIDEMTGGTFTITNGGVFGSMMSTPILNAPQSGILGMHNIIDRPVALNGQVVIRPMMYVALSYDHRVIDGRESVGFLVKVKQYIEDPYRLLLDV
jgi:2-oxoglutarate dehydrogenase E2 component (dihydrolipoamide succinyltransferase)